MAAKHMEDRAAQKKAVIDQQNMYKEVWGAQKALKMEYEATEKLF